MTSEGNEHVKGIVSDITCANLIATSDEDDMMTLQINEIKYWLKCALIMTSDMKVVCERKMLIEN